MIRNKKYLLLLLFSSYVFAQQGDDPIVAKNGAGEGIGNKVKSRSGYEIDEIGYGGRASVGGDYGHP